MVISHGHRPRATVVMLQADEITLEWIMKPVPPLPAPSVPVSGPLSDLVVVSLEQAVAAPFATRQLADLGARVIKIERPGSGDLARGYDRTVRGISSHFV